MRLLSPDRYQQDGYPWTDWDRLRQEEGPVRIERDGFSPYWAVTRHAQVIEVSQSTAYSSAHGIRIAAEESLELPEGVLPYSVGDHMLVMDPPEHTVWRQLTARGFRADRLNTSEIVDDISSHVLDELNDGAGGEPFDFVRRTAIPITVAAAADLLGFSNDQQEQLAQVTNPLLRESSGDTPEERAQKRWDTTRELFEFIDMHLTRPIGGDEDQGLLKEIARATIDGTPLSKPALFGMCHLLIVAGIETSRNSLAGAMYAFAEYPKQWERVLDDPSLLPSAVEEALRWASPVIHFARTASEELTLGDKTIEKGDQLALFYPAANRDPSIFDAPYRFDVARAPNRHLAFGGFGPHQCLGARIARLELQGWFQALCDRQLRWKLAGTPERLRGTLAGGYAALPLRFIE